MTAAMRSRDAEAELNLPPGFRFHPTDEELVLHYLCRKAAKQGLPVPIIADVDLYRYDPWDLPEKALFGQREWYFFTPRDRKYPNGSRPNRAAGKGYWKATGADKPISPPGSARPLGIKKALVFYHGKAPRGVKTDWIMHEYRLADASRAATKKGSLRLDDWVLCRLYNKKNSYEKMVKQQKPKEEEVSFGETMDSSSSDTGSESHRTPESDIEFLDLDALKASDAGSFQTVEQQQQQQENNDWFTDLNLDDLQSSFGLFRSMSGFDLSNQDYYFSSQTNLPPF